MTGRAVRREGWRAFKFEEGVWRFLGDAQEVERSEARRKILACLQAAPGAMTPKAIAEQAGLSRGFVRYLLRDLLPAIRLGLGKR